jgi:electron transfer flavoprotein beta subunit
VKIVVCVKLQTGAAVDKDDAFLRVGRTLSATLPPFDAHAVEEALRIRERGGVTEIVAVGISPAENMGGLRDALAMGADRAILLSDAAVAGSDILATSRLLAALLEREAADLYLYCPWSGDTDGSLLWLMTAERLGLPAIGQIRKLEIEHGIVRGERQADRGDYVLKTAMPCLVELSENINKARNVTIKGKQLARTRPIKLVTLADLGLDPDKAGEAGAATRIMEMKAIQSTRERIILEGDGDAPGKVVAFLKQRGLIA